MAAKAPPLETFFKELDSFVKDSDYENVVKTSDKILQANPNDNDAFSCKVVAYIHLGKNEEAVSLINSSKSNSYDFEKAYCLYRLKRFDEALTLCRNSSIKSDRLQKLEAQVLYRLEDFKQSANVYKTLVENSDDISPEVITNTCAAFVSGQLIKDGNDFIRSNKASLSDTFEFSYNAGCLAIEDGDLKLAEKYLKDAQEKCKSILTDDGASEDEIMDELAIIITQLAFVYQMQNKDEEAMKLYNTVLKAKPSDESVTAVASNNTVSLKQEHQLYDSFKKMKQATSQSLEQKLTTNQKKIIGFNRCLVLLHMKQADQCRELVKFLEEQFPNNDRLALISSALLYKENKVTKSEELLKNFASSNPDNSLRVQLSLAQLYLSKDNIPEAIKILESITSLKKKPAFIATLVTLYEQTGNAEAAMKLWDDYCNDLQKGDEDAYINALKRNAEFKLKAEKYREAAAIYEKVIKLNSNDLEALPGLVIAYSHFDPVLAEKSNRLPHLDDDTEVDVDALENLAAPKIGAQQEIVQKSEKVDKPKQKKKKKKKLLPKNFDPNKPVDPERWIPLKQRSTFKKKGRKGKHLEKGAQGVAPVEKRPGYDKTNAPPVKETPAPAVASPKQASQPAKQPTQPAKQAAAPTKEVRKGRLR